MKKFLLRCALGLAALCVVAIVLACVVILAVLIFGPQMAAPALVLLMTLGAIILAAYVIGDTLCDEWKRR